MVPMLSLLILVPAVGGTMAVLLRRSAATARALALLVAAIDLVLAFVLLISFDGRATAPQYIERAVWMPALGIEYSLAVDGVSALMIPLTALLGLLALLLGGDELRDRAGAYAGSILFLVAGVTGAFAARDLFLFFVFWEAMLVPMYLLVALCGGPRRAFAATKFFLYTTFGSLLMLVAIIALYSIHQQQTGVATMDLAALASTRLPLDTQIWLFLAFALAFAIKVPLVPLHTWIGDLYAQSPVPALVVATMLVKVGGYGLMRYAIPLFPDAARQMAPVLLTLAVVGIIYAGIVAATQPTLTGVMAYSSVAQLGFVVLGIFALNPIGYSGAAIHMVSHGVSAGAIFAIVAMILRRTGTVRLDQLGGLGARWPILAGMLAIAVFSSAGLPGLNGFVGEYLVLLGAYQSQPVLAAIATGGVVISAIYLLRLYRRSMHGPLPGPTGKPPQPDARPLELLVLAPLLVLVFWTGLFPNALLGKLDGSTASYLPPAATRAAESTPTLDQLLAVVTPK